MLIFAAIAGLVSLIVGWAVTWRLFGLARRTGALPESLLAIAFCGLFSVGFPLTAASRAPALVMTYEGSLFFTLGALGMLVGIAALARFPYVVFHPSEQWAGLLSLAIGVLGAVGSVGAAGAVTFATSEAAMIAEIQPWTIALMLSVASSFLWNGMESIRYYANMKKRASIGLSSPEITHRFLLWSIASAACTLLVVAMIVIRAAGLPVLAPLGAILISSVALVAATCWWLAFFMPDLYQRRVLGIAPSEA